MNVTSERKGDLFIIGQTFLFSLFPVVTISIFGVIPPLFSYSLVMLLSAIFFGIILAFRGEFGKFRNISALKDIFLASFFIGFLYYGMTFIGLKYTTAGSASIVLLMEVFFTYLIFSLRYNEHHKPLHIFGAIMMCAGALFILFPGKISLNKGDLLILAATMFAPIGNHFAKRARRQIGSINILVFRTFIIGIAFLFISLIFEPIPAFSNIKASIPLLLFSSIFIFGVAIILWLEGINLISVSRAISISTFSPAFTLLFAYFFLHEIPTIWQILGFIPIAIGAIMILYNFEEKKK